MLKDKIINSVKTLPPLNENVRKIYAICSDDNSSLKDLSAVVEKDSMLTANILKSANSPLYGFSREITNVSNAINLFGMATIKGFAMASAAKNSFKLNLEAYKISEGDFLNISTLQNGLAVNWLKTAQRDVADVVVPASFLLEIGKVVIASELYSNNMHKEFKAKLENIETIEALRELELDFIGVSSEEVASIIFDNWKLDKELVESILYSYDPEDAPSSIQSACQYLFIIKQLVNVFGMFKENSVSLSLSLAKQYNLNTSSLEKAIQKQKEALG